MADIRFHDLIYVKANLAIRSNVWVIGDVPHETVETAASDYHSIE